MEKQVKEYFRSLNVQEYEKTFHLLPLMVDEVRNSITNLPLEQRNIIHGILAEECASTLIRMYQTRFESYLIEGLIFEYEPEMTTEVDLIFLTRNMVYIIECKHRSNNIEVQADGSFKTGDKVESPVNQNLGHIRKLFKKLEYGNLVPNQRIFNIVYLLFNNGALMKNPLTLFEKEGVNGAFANYKNLLPLVNKLENERNGGKIPIKTLYNELINHGKEYRGELGRNKHIENLRRKYNE